jgi:cell division septal protein FtsQ
MHVLEAILPTEKELGIHRRRRWQRVMKYGGLLLLCGLSTWGLVYGARDFLQAQNDFRVSALDVLTTGELTREEILKVAEISEGDSLLGTAMQQVRERLEAHPWVHHARLEKKAGQRLVIEIDERRPVAWMAADVPFLKAFSTQANNGGLLIDAEGYLLPVQRLESRLMHLPVIHTHELPTRQAGVRVQREDLLAAVKLIEEARQTFSSEGLDIVEIEASSGWSLETKFNDDSAVTFGTEALREQLQRLREVRRCLRLGAKRLQHANVICEKNVPVTLMLSTPAASSAPDLTETESADQLPPLIEVVPTDAPAPSPVEPVSQSEKTRHDFQQILR